MAVTALNVKLNNINFTPVTKKLEIIHESGGVGRWSLELDNLTDATQILSENMQVELGINNVTLMQGKIDNILPEVNDESAVFSKTATIEGRNYGRDLVDKFIIGKYSQMRLGFLINQILAEAGSLLSCPETTTGPILDAKFDRQFLQTAIVDLCQKNGYDFTVQNDMKVDIWPLVQSPDSGVSLKSVIESVNNNILEVTPEGRISEDIRNYIRCDAGKLEDHWTEANATDWTCINNAAQTISVTNDDTKQIGGSQSIKANTTSGDGYTRLFLEFPKYYHQTLDLSDTTETEYSIWVWCDYINYFGTIHGNVVNLYLMDTLGNEIVSSFHVKPYNWTECKVKIGTQSEFIQGAIYPAVVESVNSGKWHYLSGSNFNWNIKRIGVATDVKGALYVDRIECPGIDVFAIAEDITRYNVHGKRMIPLTRTDVRSQVELQAVADFELQQRKNRVDKLTLTCTYQPNIKYAGYLVDVLIPDAYIGAVGAPVKYRVQKVTHTATPGTPIIRGFDAVTRLELIKHEGGATADLARSKLATPNPQSSINIRINDRLQVLEKSVAGVSSLFSAGGGGSVFLPDVISQLQITNKLTLDNLAVWKDSGNYIDLVWDDGAGWWRSEVKKKAGFTPSQNFCNLFVTSLSPLDWTTNLNDPIWCCDQYLFVEKDIQTFGAFMTDSDPRKGAGGGAVMIGGGFEHPTDPPRVNLTKPGYTELAVTAGSSYDYVNHVYLGVDDVLANVKLAQLTCVNIVGLNGLPVHFGASGLSIGGVGAAELYWQTIGLGALELTSNMIIDGMLNVGTALSVSGIASVDVSFTLGTKNSAVRLTPGETLGTRHLMPEVFDSNNDPLPLLQQDKKVGLGTEGHSFAYARVERVYADEFRKLTDGTLWDFGLWQAGEVTGITAPLKVVSKSLLLDQTLISIGKSQINDWSSSDLVVNSVKVVSYDGNPAHGAAFKVGEIVAGVSTDFLSLTYDANYSYVTAHYRPLYLSSASTIVFGSNIDFNNKTFSNYLGSLGTGTPSASTYLRGDGTWASVSAGNPFNQNLNTSNDAIFNSVQVKSASGNPSLGGVFKVSDGTNDVAALGYDATYATLSAHYRILKLAALSGVIFDCDINFNNKSFSNYLGSLGSGTPNASTFLRGDGTWTSVPASNPFDQNLNKANDAMFNSVQVKSATGVASEGGAFKVHDGSGDVAAITYNATYSTLSAHNRKLRLSASSGIFIDGDIDFNNKSFSNYLSSLGSGTPSASTFLRGDGTWATPSAAGNPFDQNLNKANDAIFNSVKVVSADGDPTKGAMFKIGNLLNDFLVISYDATYSTISTHNRELKLSSATTIFANNSIEIGKNGIGTEFGTVDGWLRPCYGMVIPDTPTLGAVNFMSHSWCYQPCFAWRDGLDNSLYMSLDASGNLKLKGDLSSISGVLDVSGHLKVAHFDHTNITINGAASGKSAMLNLKSNNVLKAAFAYDAPTNKTYLAAYSTSGTFSELNLQGSKIVLNNDTDFLGSVVNINRDAGAAFNIRTTAGATRLTLGWDASNSYITATNAGNFAIVNNNGSINFACSTGEIWTASGLQIKPLLPAQGQLGNTSNYWYNVVTKYVQPGVNLDGECGVSSFRWKRGWFEFTHTTGPGTWDHFDDLALATLWGREDNKIPGYYDTSKEVPEGRPFDFLRVKNKEGKVEEGETWINLTDTVGFAMCCIRELALEREVNNDIMQAFYDGVAVHDSKIEELEAKIARLEAALTTTL